MVYGMVLYGVWYGNGHVSHRELLHVTVNNIIPLRKRPFPNRTQQQWQPSTTQQFGLRTIPVPYHSEKPNSWKDTFTDGIIRTTRYATITIFLHMTADKNVLKRAESLPFGTWFNGIGGSFILGSGVTGYLRRRRDLRYRTTSLVAGASLGSAMLLSSYLLSLQQQQQENSHYSYKFQGHALGAATGLVGYASMTFWFLQSGRILPAGVICLVSTLCFGYNQKKLLEQSDNRQQPTPSTTTTAAPHLA
eukprot:scaffold9085_cov215-Amphora_coffeaeformis.AAC.28